MYLSSLISELNFYKDLKMLSKEFYIKIKEIYNKYKDYYNRPSSCFASDLKFKDCIVDLLLKDKNYISLNRTYLESVKKLLNFTSTNVTKEQSILSVRLIKKIYSISITTTLLINLSRIDIAFSTAKQGQKTIPQYSLSLYNKNLTVSRGVKPYI